MINSTADDYQRRILEKTKRKIDLQFRGFREGKYTSRHTYRSVIHAYARYIVLQQGKVDMSVDIADVQTYITELKKRGRSESYISSTLSAIKYYIRKTYGKDCRIMHQLENKELIGIKEI